MKKEDIHHHLNKGETSNTEVWNTIIIAILKKETPWQTLSIEIWDYYLNKINSQIKKMGQFSILGIHFWLRLYMSIYNALST